MDDRLSRLEEELRALRERVGVLERRLAGAGSFEGAETIAGGGAVPPGITAAEPVPGERADTTTVLSLVGRTFIVLGGAFLLRALTDAGTLPAAGGVGLGLLYALVWLVAAGRASGRPLSAAFHAIAFTLIAFPLAGEATLRFGLLRPPVSAAMIGALAAAALAVAWRRSDRVLAWLATLAALGAAIALLVGTGEPLPYVILLVLLGVGTLWLSYDRDWFGLRWPTALAADLGVAGLTLRALAATPREEPTTVIAVQLGLVGAYLASIAARTLIRGRNVVPFELAQAALALAVGLAGAAKVTAAAGAGGALLGAACLALGAGAYGVAFAFVDRRQGRGRNFYFYSFLALVFALVGTRQLLSGAALAAAWSLLGVFSAWIGARASRGALFLHGAVYLAGAGLAAGLHRAVAAAFAGLPAQGPSWPGPVIAAVFAGAVLAAAVPRFRHADEWEDLARLPRLAILLVAVAAAGAFAVPAGLVLAGEAARSSPEAAAATLRTVILAAAALALALLGRIDRLQEARWLVYPLLAAGALKLVAEDLRRSPPAWLVPALAAYGTALILAPRLLGGSRRAASSAPAGGAPDA